jgi:hypothetical protein
MDNQSFFKHLESVSNLATEASDIGELEDFLDAIQMVLMTRNMKLKRKLTEFSLDANSLN